MSYIVIRTILWTFAAGFGTYVAASQGRTSMSIVFGLLGIGFLSQGIWWGFKCHQQRQSKKLIKQEEEK